MNQQFVAIALASAPTMITVLIGIPINNARLSDLSARITDVNGRIADVRSEQAGFGNLDRRFDEMHELLRSELRRVEK